MTTAAPSDRTEQMHGSGNPDRLKGVEIPLPARVLQVVDIYDALITASLYNLALSMEAALASLDIMSRTDASCLWHQIRSL